MELFDTHFHCDDKECFAGFLERCRADLSLAAIDYRTIPDRLSMLCAGSNYPESLNAQKFAAAVPDVWFACGIHPHSAAEYLPRKNECDFTVFRKDPKLVAIGEIGLDYFYDFSDKASQRQVLQEFLDLALAWDLPAMLHLRDKDNSFEAYEDALEMLTGFAGRGGRFVIHCYAGNAEYAGKFLKLGGYFGVTGMYTFKAAHNIREAIAAVPLENLLIETDSPYLAPVPYRGRSNTPGMVALVAQALGADRQLTPEDAAAVFTANAKKFYRIDQQESI